MWEKLVVWLASDLLHMKSILDQLLWSFILVRMLPLKVAVYLGSRVPIKAMIDSHFNPTNHYNRNRTNLDMPKKSASSSSHLSSSSFKANVTSSSHTESVAESRARGRTSSHMEPKAESMTGGGSTGSSSKRDPGGLSTAGGGGGAGSRSSVGSWESGKSHNSGGSEGRGGALPNPVSSLTLLLNSSAAFTLASCKCEHGQ